MRWLFAFFALLNLAGACIPPWDWRSAMALVVAGFMAGLSVAGFAIGEDG